MTNRNRVIENANLGSSILDQHFESDTKEAIYVKALDANIQICFGIMY